jgi:putative DNA primase/helicase
MTLEEQSRREADRMEKQRKRFLDKAARKSNGKKNGGGNGGDEPPVETWKKKLRRTPNDKSFMGDMKNAELAFEHAPALMGLVRFNELSRRIELQRQPPWRTSCHAREWGDDDDVALACLLQGEGIPIHSEVAVSRVVHLTAYKNSFHPVRDWLRSLKWDGGPRIKEVLIEALSAHGRGEYLGAVLVSWMVSAVARVMKPGCKADHMLVLIGDERIRKSSFAQVLGSPWTVESNSTFGSKDAIAELEGAWIIEVAELAATLSARWETINHFLSRQVDHYRPAYGRAVIDQPRSCVFIATTHEQKFLRSPYGNRRAWPVRCSRMDLDLLRAAREQLWAEAVALFDAGRQWHLTDEEEVIAAQVQEDHRIVSEVEEDVRGFLQRCLEREPNPKTDVTVTEVFEAIAGQKESDSINARKQVEQQIGLAIRRAGWEYCGRKGDERRTTYTFKGAKA